MCDVLSDIEVAQDLLEPKQQEEEQVELQPHPADEKYATLKADLKIIPPEEEEYRVVEKYCQVTLSNTQLLQSTTSLTKTVRQLTQPQAQL